MSHWSSQFVGIPYQNKGRDYNGCDCWGIVRLGFHNRTGIWLPSYDDEYISTNEVREIDAIVSREAMSPNWKPITDAREMDVVFFRRGRMDAHAGLIIGARSMLHMVEEDCSKISDFTRPIPGLRLTGIYRWVGK